jgi:hypothetical protein
MRLSSANLQEIWQRRRTSGWELRGRPDELAGLKGVQEGKKKTEVIIRMMIDPMMRQKKQPAESGSLLRPSSPLVQLCAADAQPPPLGSRKRITALSAAGLACFCDRWENQRDDSLPFISPGSASRSNTTADFMHNGVEVMVGQLTILTNPPNPASEERGKRIHISHSIPVGK